MPLRRATGHGQVIHAAMMGKNPLVLPALDHRPPASRGNVLEGVSSQAASTGLTLKLVNHFPVAVQKKRIRFQVGPCARPQGGHG